MWPSISTMCLLNEEIYPAPLPWLTWGGGNTEFTIVDDYTFKYTFAAPYGSFIEAEVTLWPATFYKHLYPAHYLSQYHIDYADPDELLAMMQEEEYNTMDEWVQFFGDKRALWGVDNTFMDNGKVFPTLNPLHHRRGPGQRQLPARAQPLLLHGRPGRQPASLY